MASINLYLDTRAAKTGSAPVKLSIAQGGKTVYIGTDVHLTPKQWDKKTRTVINHPLKADLNRYLMKRKMEAEDALREYSLTNAIRSCTAAQLRDIILNVNVEPVEQKPLFIDSFNSFVALKKEGTKRIYMETYSIMQKYTDLSTLTFEDITREWLTTFDRHMESEGAMTNTRGIHLRNIRAVFNYAIDNEVISFYPFRKFKIIRERTPKRALSVEQLRTLFNYPVEEYAVEYLDLFKLIFFLIGINIADLTHLKNITNDGRIEYNRAKTHRPYSIKVEPEAMKIIAKYRGKNYLLSPLDHFKSYVNYVAHMNTALQRIGEVEYIKNGRGRKKVWHPLFPELTTYWARHSWASVAAELDIPKETIAKALGHGGNSVTDIYIDFDMKKVDEANRKVIDYVLYGKKE